MQCYDSPLGLTSSTFLVTVFILFFFCTVTFYYVSNQYIDNIPSNCCLGEHY